MAQKRLFSSLTFRFSIRQLLLWTAFVAVGCVALRSASSTWVAALLGVTLLILTAALPLAIFRQGTERAYWLGFALFGWMYMLVLAYGWSLDPNTSQSNPLRPYSLVTTHLSSSGYERIYGASSPQSYPVYVQARNAIAAYTVAVASGVPTTTYAPAPMPPAANYYVNPSSGYVVTAPVVLTATGPAQDDFVNVAHALWAIVLATCGGWFTRWLYATRPAAQKDAADGAPEASTAA